MIKIEFSIKHFPTSEIEVFVIIFYIFVNVLCELIPDLNIDC